MHQSIGNTNRVNCIVSLYKYDSSDLGLECVIVSVAGKGTKWCTSLFIYTVVLGSVKWFYI